MAFITGKYNRFEYHDGFDNTNWFLNVVDYYTWADIYDTHEKIYLSSTGYIKRVYYTQSVSSLFFDNNRYQLLHISEILCQEYRDYCKEIEGFIQQNS